MNLKWLPQKAAEGGRGRAPISGAFRIGELFQRLRRDTGLRGWEGLQTREGSLSGGPEGRFFLSE
jgi:hypothetical protein